MLFSVYARHRTRGTRLMGKTSNWRKMVNDILAKPNYRDNRQDRLVVKFGGNDGEIAIAEENAHGIMKKAA